MKRNVVLLILFFNVFYIVCAIFIVKQSAPGRSLEMTYPLFLFALSNTLHFYTLRNLNLTKQKWKSGLFLFFPFLLYFVMAFRFERYGGVFQRMDELMLILSLILLSGIAGILLVLRFSKS